jgi:hypothetical protein
MRGVTKGESINAYIERSLYRFPLVNIDPVGLTSVASRGTSAALNTGHKICPPRFRVQVRHCTRVEHWLECSSSSLTTRRIVRENKCAEETSWM